MALDSLPLTTPGPPPPRPSPPLSRVSRACAYVPGATLVAYAIVLLALSSRLARDPSGVESARAWLTATSMLAGAIYLAAMYWARATFGRHFLAWTIGSALLARGLVCVAPPLLETDFYRYLWDGAVTAQGISPYRYTPESVSEDSVHTEDEDALRALARNSGKVLPSINHPGLTTIYPPLAQGAFAAAHAIDPFGLAGWRLVLFAFDGLTVFLLARWLQALSLPVHRIAWYLSNPLLLREVYSALHMDVLVLPFLVGATLLATRRRHGWAALLCVLGSAVKVWPALLIPLFLRPLWRRWKTLTLACIGLASVAAFVWMPVWSAAGGETNGFLAYGETWQNNDGFFRAGIWITERFLGLLSVAPWHSHSVMRVLAASILFAILLWQVRTSRNDGPENLRSFLVVVGSAFLLSPTQFPWYWIWCLPLLSVRPSLPLMLYVALLPLFHLQDWGTAVYWIEHLPVWGLLVVIAVHEQRPPRNAIGTRLEASHA